MARSVIEGGSSKAAAARAFHTTPKTVAKWVARFRAEGVAGLQDRSSRPHSSPSQTRPAACEGSRLCAGSATPASRSPRKSGFRPPPSAASSNGWASIGLPLSSRPSRSAAMNAPRPARSSTSTSRSSASSIGSVTGSPATGSARASPAGWLGICASGDRRPLAARLFGDPAGREANLLPALSLQRPALLSKPRRQGRAHHDRQRLKLSAPIATPRPCAGSGSSICEPNPTRPEPTERPSASSRPACANGPTPERTTPPINAPPNCPSGFTATTGIAPMAASEPNLQSAESP